ncbi:MAG: type III secretion system export apparatus subunit SctU [Candidatus Velthaea sp.]
MSGDSTQKTFDPTPARKQKAMHDGNVARSSEISGLTGFACAAAATFAVVPVIGAAACQAMRELLRTSDFAHPSPSLGIALGFALVPAAAAATGATAAGLLQCGGLRITAPKLQFAKLNPLTGLKRMIGGEAVLGAARAMLAFLLATAVLWPLATEMFARSGTLPGPAAFGLLVLNAAQRAFFATIAVGALFAVADYALARRRWIADLKMSHEELRRDQKENDGDPHTRSRRRTLHRTLVRGSIQRTREASFVVVNPTHIALAIRYAPPEVPVPEIVVRAAGDAALAVKAIATEAAIPVIENIPLARALYAQGMAGRAIPSETFVAVARVIAALIKEGVIA